VSRVPVVNDLLPAPREMTLSDWPSTASTSYRIRGSRQNPSNFFQLAKTCELHAQNARWKIIQTRVWMRIIRARLFPPTAQKQTTAPC